MATTTTLKNKMTTPTRQKRNSVLSMKLRRRLMNAAVVVGAIVLIWNQRHLQNLLRGEDQTVNTNFASSERINRPTTGSRRPDNNNINNKDGSSSSPGTLAGLNCDNYDGGPSNDIAVEMVYWRDIPSDANYTSPFANYGPSPKYLTFEPDEGGWNNIRMSMETATALAVAMGRTLVLPPTQPIYLLWNDPKSKNNRFTFQDFFPFAAVAAEHPAVDVISMQEFLEQHNTSFFLRDKHSGQPSRPPRNQTNWDDRGLGTKDFFRALDKQKKLWLWLRNVTASPVWSFERCVVAIGAEPGQSAVDAMKERQRQIAALSSLPLRQQRQQEIQMWRPRDFDDNPTPVDAPVEARLRELLGNRRELCIYDDDLQNANVIHFMGDNDSGARLLTHFYSYMLLEDWHQDLWIKRFVRDHLRYNDEIQCAAARVVRAVREKARGHGNLEGLFDTFHIRRGDFQYESTRIDAEEIYNNVRDVLEENSTIYIATDERNMTFFDPLKKHYHIYFLDDFTDILAVNKNYYGMLDQLIASRGRTFIGTYFSTFTGYINRIRGYHAQKGKLLGRELGRINSFFYVPKDMKHEMQHYRGLKAPMWAREFPIGWRDIDKDLEESQLLG